MLWKFENDYFWKYSNLLIHEDNFIIKDDSENLLAINKKTGTLSWKNNDTVSSTVTMRIYDNRIYFSKSGIFIIDARSGETLYRNLCSPNNADRYGAKFLNAIAVDVDKKIMYATDHFYLMAIKLPE